MKTTDSKDLVKVNQIFPIMKEYFGKSMNLTHIKRFIANYSLNLVLIARMFFSLLPVRDSLVLSMDRTNWKFGEFNINIPTLVITCKGIAFPLLDKRGDSNWEDRKAILDRFIRLFGHDCIDCLVADCDFINKELIGWLDDNRILYYIRIRQDIWVVKPSTGERIRVWWLFNSRKLVQKKFYCNLFYIKGSMSISPNSNQEL